MASKTPWCGVVNHCPPLFKEPPPVAYLAYSELSSGFLAGLLSRLHFLSETCRISGKGNFVWYRHATDQNGDAYGLHPLCNQSFSF